jgi:hypothetical protein
MVTSILLLINKNNFLFFLPYSLYSTHVPTTPQERRPLFRPRHQDLGRALEKQILTFFTMKRTHKRFACTTHKSHDACTCIG